MEDSRDDVLHVACAGTKALMTHPASEHRYLTCLCGLCDAAKKYTPPEFEAHCGRGAARSWKTTIRVVGADGSTTEKLKDWLERRRPSHAAEDDESTETDRSTSAVGGGAAAILPQPQPPAAARAGPSSSQAQPKKKRGRPPKAAATAQAATSSDELAKKQRAPVALPPPQPQQQKWVVPAQLFLSGDERPRAYPSPIPHIGDIVTTQHAREVMDKRAAAAFDGLPDGVYSASLPPQPVCEPDQLPSIYERTRVAFEKDMCSPIYTSIVGRKLQAAGVLEYPARKLLVSRDLPPGSILCLYFGNVHTGKCRRFFVWFLGSSSV